MRERWKGADGRIYEWDSQHGSVEVYNKKGIRHLGEWGWILREMGGDGPVDDDTNIDWVLLPVFARSLGEDLAYMQGPAFGDSFPLDRSTFTHIARLFEVDADFDEASWFLDQHANTPLDG